MEWTVAVGCRSSQNKYWFAFGEIWLVLYELVPGSRPGAAESVTLTNPYSAGEAMSDREQGGYIETVETQGGIAG